ncbi:MULTISPECIES: polyphosphate--glucose phosphotransferase [Gordonia]|uniref:Polyphosphate glucokinase n=2 Tax=Gordonia TaxID=2053 RepID=L7LLE8_9ACTN|nr:MULTISPECIES: ROK family protein [Gordonia]AUH69178.1 ROK family protein [Gordonia sp. YC-JH1]KJR08146.1 polyphosphate glucokinase [Gordonia sihwensis]KXT57861.1 polyphosphate glucokinase [Gordonia sp. QH-12]MBY4569693.1 polyphosphate glucokinase [Gordonia sihwensis]WFN94531.1 ROK family protein [Gordonia sihwensis]
MTDARFTVLASDRSPSPSSDLGFGIDIGGSGVKGAIVDLRTGQFVGERHRIATPQPATPAAVADTVAEIVEHFGWTGPVGLTVPGVVRQQIMRSAANIDESWKGTDLYALFSDRLGGRRVTVLNDADAAGIAEYRFGSGVGDAEGTVILLTFGTGIGSALLYNGTLVPNTELGHLEIDGKEAEHRASAKVREDHGWSLEKWSKKVSKVLRHYEAIFSPTLFIAGGGISRKADQWIPLLTNQTPVVAAELRNTAGIVGAAIAVDEGLSF